MLKRAIVAPILVAGLMTLWMGTALADSHGDGGNATSTDDGMATSTDDGMATSTDDGMATSTDSIWVAGEGDDSQSKSFPGVVHYLGDGMVTIGNDLETTAQYLNAQPEDVLREFREKWGRTYR